MTGPPTPPITSEIEIEDAARAAGAAGIPAASDSVAHAPVVSQALAAETSEQNPSTPFRAVFAHLSQLVAATKFDELVEIAEVADLSVRTHQRPSCPLNNI